MVLISRSRCRRDFIFPRMTARTKIRQLLFSSARVPGQKQKQDLDAVQCHGTLRCFGSSAAFIPAMPPIYTGDDPKIATVWCTNYGPASE